MIKPIRRTQPCDEPCSTSCSFWRPCSPLSHPILLPQPKPNPRRTRIRSTSPARIKTSWAAPVNGCPPARTRSSVTTLKTMCGRARMRSSPPTTRIKRVRATRPRSTANGTRTTASTPRVAARIFRSWSARPHRSSSIMTTRLTGSPITSTKRSWLQLVTSNPNSAVPAMTTLAACAHGCKTPKATGCMPLPPAPSRPGPTP